MVRLLGSIRLVLGLQVVAGSKNESFSSLEIGEFLAVIYSTDNRETWERFRVLGWDRFLAFVGKSELKAWQLQPYRKLPPDFDQPLSDFILVPMLFQLNSEASKEILRVIDGFLKELSRDMSPESADEIRAKNPWLAGTLGDSEVIKVKMYGTLSLALELEHLRDLMKSGDVWVAWPNQRRSLRTSRRLEVDKIGKRLFDEWQIFTTSERWGAPGNKASVIAALRTPEHRKGVVLTELQRSVMWRATHFAAMQAFADFAIIALHPGGTVPKVPAIGCAVATRGVMELAAHYLEGPGDPFESGEGFDYSENLGKLDLGAEYKKVLSFFKSKTYWEEDLEVTDKAIHETCSGVLRKAWNLLNTNKRLSDSRSDYRGDGVVFEPYPEMYVLSEWRTSIERHSLDSQIEVAAFGYEWLIALWEKSAGPSNFVFRRPIIEHQVNTRVFCWDLASLIKRVQEYQHPKHPEFQRPLAAIAGLLRTFCLASNLNPLVAGAIARELHLHVEELIVKAEHSEPYDNDTLKDLESKGLERSVEYQAEKAKQDDKSLKCIEKELQGASSSLQGIGRQAPDLNALRVRLQDVLQSFAHPGWLIRTETARFAEPKDGISEVRISNRYVSPFSFAYFDPLTMVVKSYPYVEQRESNSFYAAFREHIPAAVSMAMRDMSTRQSGAERVPGSAFEIPFAAVEICRIALEYFLRVGPKETPSPAGKPAS